MSPTAGFGGRWSLVETLAQAASPTERAHAAATALLDRWGVVSRDAAVADDLPGGFAALADVFDTMEESGAVRRGYFVEGLAGRQYAWPGALDRLRGARDREGGVIAMAAADPANPWGAVLPWPDASADQKPTRRAGALVVLVGGAPVYFVEPRGKKLMTFEATSEELRERGARGLAECARLSPRRQLVVESIDGARAQDSGLSALLARAGARADYRGFVIESRGAAVTDDDLEDDQDAPAPAPG